MDDDRKYRQRGYMDSERDSKDRRFPDRPKTSGPRPPSDVTGPRLPRLLQNVVAARCFNCSTALAGGSGLEREMPQVRRCVALLQAMRAFRTLHPLPMLETDAGAHRGEGSDQRVRAV